VPQTQLLELPDCGHSPQRDQPAALIDACVAFMRGHARVPPGADPKTDGDAGAC
jgi:hypothetical protein